MSYIGNKTTGTLVVMGEHTVYVLWTYTASIAKPAVTTRAWFYGRKNTSGSGTVKVGLYKKGASEVLSTLVDTATITMTQGEDPWPGQWWSADFSAALECGNEYIIAAMGEGITGWMLMSASSDTGNRNIADTGSYEMPATLSGAALWNSKFAAYVEYTEFDEADFSADSSGSFPIMAQVNPHPMLTSDRAPTYSAGHEPKNVLDGNLDTYWEPEDRNDDSLWFDLGEDTSVYAIVIWLRNYNESWGPPKSWQVACSLDDGGYYTFAEKEFGDYKDNYAPIVVDVLANTLSARYWRVTFKGFNSYPRTVAAQVSAVWFVKPYYMPQRRTLPATDTIKYLVDVAEDALGRSLTQQVNYGQLTTAQISLTLLTQTDADRAAAMYEAARHGARPVICKPRYADEAWRLMRISGFSLARSKHDLWVAAMSLEDVGHRLVERYNVPNIRHPETVGSWSFNESLHDWSAKENHLTGVDVSSDDYVCAPGWYGKTALTFYDGDMHWAYIAEGAPSSDFDMGTSDFTIELSMLMTSGGANMDIISKWDNSPYSGWRLTARVSGSDMLLYVTLADGTEIVNLQEATGAPLDDNEWHHIAAVVDRAADTLKMYVDGTQHGGDKDISSLTGNISAPAYPLYVWPSGNTYTAIDFIEVTRRAFTQAEIVERMAGHKDYWEWRA